MGSVRPLGSGSLWRVWEVWGSRGLGCLEFVGGSVRSVGSSESVGSVGFVGSSGGSVGSGIWRSWSLGFWVSGSLGVWRFSRRLGLWVVFFSINWTYDFKQCIVIKSTAGALAPSTLSL